jgi:hypothetical protein
VVGRAPFTLHSSRTTHDYVRSTYIHWGTLNFVYKANKMMSCVLCLVSCILCPGTSPAPVAPGRKPREVDAAVRPGVHVPGGVRTPDLVHPSSVNPPTELSDSKMTDPPPQTTPLPPNLPLTHLPNTHPHHTPLFSTYPSRVHTHLVSHCRFFFPCTKHVTKQNPVTTNSRQSSH